MKLSIAARKITVSSFGILWFALLGQSGALSQPLEESKIYWSHPELGIHRSDLDGSNVEPLVVPDLRRPDKIALDVAGGKIYWTEWAVAAIHRSDLDGSNLETVVDSTKFSNGYPGWNGITGIALDVSRGKMYWTEYTHHGDYVLGWVMGSNLDGSNREVLGQSGPQLRDIALDLAKDKVYLSDDYGTIYRVDPDGNKSIYGEFLGDENVILSDFSGQASIALDVEGGKIYWINRSTQTVHRADLDGTNVEIVLTVSEGTLDEIILLDVDGSRIYWTNEGTQTIQVADLDGKNVKHFFDLGQLHLTGSLADIALDIEGDKIYFSDSGQGHWVARGAGTIQRIGLNGQNGEVLFDPRVRHPHGIALDRDKLYWTDVVKGTIHRADLNGQNGEVLFSGLNRPRDIALLDRKKVYWAAEGSGKIQAAGLDGSPVEDIVTGVDRPKIIDLDRPEIFWADGNSVFRSSLDGSHHEIISSMDMGFLDLILDRDRSKVYWTSNWPSDNIIFRSNMDGSSSENLVTVDHRFVGSNQSITLDQVRQNIYWTGWGEYHTNDWNSPPSYYMEILRSNLDGSNVEQIYAVNFKSYLSSEHYPSSDIALYIPHPTSISTSGNALEIPTTSGLDPNVPNPFNGVTLIPYRLDHPGPVRLEIYNILGQPIRTLVDQVQGAGRYQVHWDGRDREGRSLASGIFLFRLVTDEGAQTRKSVLLH